MPLQLIRFRALCLITLSAALLETASSRPHTTSSSIYDALTSHGLPMGLLPKGVKDYALDTDGRFEVHLDEACNAKFECQLHFDRNVSGSLRFGQITNLTGIAAQELFLWFPVKGIRVDVPSSGLIYFDVGVVFKQFPVSLFETPPDCFAGTLPPDVEEGNSVIQTLVETRDALLIRKNLKENQDGSKDYLRGPR